MKFRIGQNSKSESAETQGHNCSKIKEDSVKIQGQNRSEFIARISQNSRLESVKTRDQNWSNLKIRISQNSTSGSDKTQG